MEKPFRLTIFEAFDHNPSIQRNALNVKGYAVNYRVKLPAYFFKRDAESPVALASRSPKLGP